MTRDAILVGLGNDLQSVENPLARTVREPPEETERVNGVKWRAMSADFPPWDRAHAFFRRWPIRAGR